MGIIYCFTSERVKMRCERGRDFLKFMVRTAFLNGSVIVDLLAFALEFSMCKMHHILVVQSLLITRKSVNHWPIAKA